MVTHIQGVSTDPSHGLVACAGDDCRVRVWTLDRADPCLPSIEPAVPPHQSRKLEEIVFPEQVHALCWANSLPMGSSDTSSASPVLLVGCAQHVYQYALTPPPPTPVLDDDAQTTP